MLWRLVAPFTCISADEVQTCFRSIRECQLVHMHRKPPSPRTPMAKLLMKISSGSPARKRRMSFSDLFHRSNTVSRLVAPSWGYYWSPTTSLWDTNQREVPRRAQTTTLSLHERQRCVLLWKLQPDLRQTSAPGAQADLSAPGVRTGKKGAPPLLPLAPP